MTAFAYERPFRRYNFERQLPTQSGHLSHLPLGENP
jgi:hypothetical protein